MGAHPIYGTWTDGILRHSTPTWVFEHSLFLLFMLSVVLGLASCAALLVCPKIYESLVDRGIDVYEGKKRD